MIRSAIRRASSRPLIPSRMIAELVAAEAGDRVAGPEARAEPLADGREELVADGVAEALVDRLEPVEVEQDQGDRVVLASRVQDSEWATRSDRSSRLGRPVIGS